MPVSPTSDGMPSLAPRARRKLAHVLCARFDLICLETLNLDAMKRLWGRKVSDLGFAEFASILCRVAEKTGARVVQIDRWEPTSKKCANCGQRQALSLAERQFNCPNCGWSCRRDQNAALNILAAGVAASAAGASAAGLGDVSRSSMSAVSA